MRIIILCYSDSTGGAAIVSRRLMDALRDAGHDARMLVCEKLTESPYVELAAKKTTIKRKFLQERLKIFCANGFNRNTLFKIDTGDVGLNLWRHPLVRNADAIMLAWVNQGMLSLKGVRRILELGKPVVWTMHDMWNMTGICHYAFSCNHFEKECGNCPVLEGKSTSRDLSFKIWQRKKKLYQDLKLMRRLRFVAVSNWLCNEAKRSKLLGSLPVDVIHNPFNITDYVVKKDYGNDNIRILFGAARLDVPIKGLDTLKCMSNILKEDYPEIAGKLELVLFGNIKDRSKLDGFGIKTIHLGVINDEDTLKKTYTESDILVSAAAFENLPGTLVEAQAYGSIPVSFLRGGQADIIEHNVTGYLADWDDDIEKRARNLSQGIIWAYRVVKDKDKYEKIQKVMYENVLEKFSYNKIVQQYNRLIDKLSKK